MSVRRQMAKGAFWLFIEKAAQQLSSFVVFAVIARLIGPEEYGAVGLCYVVLSLATAIIDSLSDSVVSLNLKDDTRLSTLFWSILAIGFAFSTLSFLFATDLAWALGSASIASLVKQFAALPFLMALVAVPTALIRQAMDFRIFTKRTFWASLTGGIVGIGFAYKGFGASALAAQQIALYTVINLVVWSGCHWKPRFLFATTELHNVLKFGVAQAGSSCITFLQQQFPRLFLSHFAGIEAVGQYVFALRLSFVLQDALFQPILLVIYPAFARLSDDDQEQKAILSELVRLLAFVFLPVAAGAVVTAPLFVPVFFGVLWVKAVPVLQIFILIIILTATSTMVRDLFRARRRTGMFLRWQGCLVAFEIVVTALLSPFGLLPFSFGILGMALLALTLYSQLAQKHLHFHLASAYRASLPSAVSAATMSAGVFFFLQSPISPTIPGLSLLCAIILGFLLYVAASLLFQKGTLLEQGYRLSLLLKRHQTKASTL